MLTEVNMTEQIVAFRNFVNAPKMNWVIPLLPLLHGVDMGKFTYYMSYII